MTIHLNILFDFCILTGCFVQLGKVEEHKVITPLDAKAVGHYYDLTSSPGKRQQNSVIWEYSWKVLQQFIAYQGKQVGHNVTRRFETWVLGACSSTKTHHDLWHSYLCGSANPLRQTFTPYVSLMSCHCLYNGNPSANYCVWILCTLLVGVALKVSGTCLICLSIYKLL